MIPPESLAALRWRLEVVKLTITELSRLTGYSERAIYLMEAGLNSVGQPVSPESWLRYKRACGSVDVELRGAYNFDWGRKQEVDNAQQRGNAQVQEGTTAQREQVRQESNEPQAGSGDHVVGEAGRG